jgi:hypothetical protein
VTLGAHLFGLLNFSQSGLELVAAAAHLFSHVTWHGEAFYRLGVQGVNVLILLGALFLPHVTPASQKGF